MARAKKRDKGEILTRSNWWYLDLSHEQIKLIDKISDGLREYYAWALECEREANESYQAAKKAAPDQKPNGKRFLNEIDLYSLWKEVRETDAAKNLFRARIPANWVLETFRAAMAGYQSFFELVKKGDLDACPPEPTPEWLFQAIPGCSSFSVRQGKVSLAPTIFGAETLLFPIPPQHQLDMLARSQRFAKFVIKREQRDMRRPGRYRISISYEIEKPETTPFVAKEAVYVALGASSIGVVSGKNPEVIYLWRPDKRLMPQIESLKAVLGFKGLGTNLHPLTKGSERWRKLVAKKQRLYDLMSNQQIQDRREIAKYLIEDHGEHMVFNELVVRSKDGKLANSEKPERGGMLGLNWSAQNVASIGYLPRWLEEKVKEYGGSVRSFKLQGPFPPGIGSEKKIPMALKLRDDFLRHMETEEAA